MADLSSQQVISPLVNFGPGFSPPWPKYKKSIIRWMVIRLVWQTGWTATNHVWCEKQATACSVTASVVNYLYFAVIGDRHVGYMPVRTTGVLVCLLVFSFCFSMHVTHLLSLLVPCYQVALFSAILLRRTYICPKNLPPDLKGKRLGQFWWNLSCRTVVGPSIVRQKKRPQTPSMPPKQVTHANC